MILCHIVFYVLFVLVDFFDNWAMQLTVVYFTMQIIMSLAVPRYAGGRPGVDRETVIFIYANIVRSVDELVH